MTDDRGQMTEDERQRIDGKGQMTDNRGGLNLEVGIRVLFLEFRPKNEYFS